MSPSPRPPVSTTLSWPGPRVWIVAFFAWTLLGLLSFGQSLAFVTYQGNSLDRAVVLTRFATTMADWWTCAVFTPGFYWMVLRFPLRGGRLASGIPAHLLASAVFVVLKIAIYAPLYEWLDPRVDQTFSGWLMRVGYYDMLGYWLTIGVIHAVVFYRQAQERTLVAARLDQELRVAELENLKAQLHPHFLFNSLQAISTLIHRDPAAADRTLRDLSELLRLSLRHTAAQEVALRDELGFLNRYFEIMRVRFGDRLSIDVDVAPDLLEARVPSLVLQPLAENAIRHGIADREDRGHVVVRGRRENGQLVLEVTDDGPGLPPGGEGVGNGIGLSNTRARLARLYGAECSLTAIPGVAHHPGKAGAGTTVRLTLPYRVPA